MRRVYQTRFGGPDAAVEDQGNCFAACVASLLEVPLESVEVYLDGLASTKDIEAHWWRTFVKWCGDRDLVPMSLTFTGDETPDQYSYGKPGLRYLALGTSPRGLGHAVVYLDGVMEHDPHPSGDGLVEVDSYVVLVAKL